MPTKPSTSGPWGRIAVLALMLLLASAAPVRAAVPFAKLEHGRSLSRAQRKTAEAVLGAAKAYHGCDKTIAACLTKRTSANEIAWRLADYVAFLAGKGLDQASILKIVAARRVSILGKVHKHDVVGWPHKGSARAKVHIVEFADFRCTHCAKVGPLLERLAERYKGKVLLVFKPYPLKPYGAPLLAAQAALAAQRQGKFWPMSKLLFAHRDKHDKAGLRELAKKAGLDLLKFDAAMTDKQILRQIEKSKIAGLRLGINRTPTIYVNGRQFRLRKDEMHLSQRIEDELHVLKRAKE